MGALDDAAVFFDTYEPTCANPTAAQDELERLRALLVRARPYVEAIAICGGGVSPRTELLRDIDAALGEGE